MEKNSAKNLVCIYYSDNIQILPFRLAGCYGTLLLLLLLLLVKLLLLLTLSLFDELLGGGGELAKAPHCLGNF